MTPQEEDHKNHQTRLQVDVMAAADRAIDKIRKMDQRQKLLQAEANQREIERRAAAMKHRMENLRTDIKVGMIVEDCGFHIGEVIECDPIEDVCIIKSMFDGAERHCSLYHCGVVEQTPDEIVFKTALYNEGGIAALSKHYESQFPEHY